MGDENKLRLVECDEAEGNETAHKHTRTIYVYFLVNDKMQTMVFPHVKHTVKTNEGRMMFMADDGVSSIINHGWSAIQAFPENEQGVPQPHGETEVKAPVSAGHYF